MVSLSLLPGPSESCWFGHSLRMFPQRSTVSVLPLRIGRSSARASAEAKAKSKSEARELGEEGYPVGAVLLTVDMLWGGKDGPNFGVGMCSEIWLRWEGPPLCCHSSYFWSNF